MYCTKYCTECRRCCVLEAGCCDRVLWGGGYWKKQPIPTNRTSTNSYRTSTKHLTQTHQHLLPHQTLKYKCLQQVFCKYFKCSLYFLFKLYYILKSFALLTLKYNLFFTSNQKKRYYS